MAGHLSGSGAAQARPGVEGGECRAFSMTLPAHRLAARLARRATQDTLASWGLDHLEETAVLLVSELVGNVLRHARARALAMALYLDLEVSSLLIEVHDTDAREPRPRTPGTLEESGFGFVLIEARDLNEAIQVASKMPEARVGSIEVRPIRESHRADRWLRGG